jgi:outer membrane protein assembly factor BamB
METGSTVRALCHSAALVLGLSSFVLLHADWPGWRGPQRDGRSPEPLPEKLPAEPKPLWKLSIGHGYSGAVTLGDTLVYVDDSQGSETAHAIDRATGKERWKTAYAKSWSDEFEPGPRCTPQIDGDRLYVQSAQGFVACLSLADGKQLWSLDFKDLGMTWAPDRQSSIGASVRRGHTGSPLVDGDRLFLQTSALNGRSVVAVDKRTGKQLWQALDEHTAYSSPVVATLAGRRQFVTATVQGLVGLDAASGGVLWRTSFQTGANRNVLTPVILGDDVLFASHTTGLRCQSIAASGETLASTQRWLVRNLNLNLSTPVVVGDWGFGLGPTRNFICFETKSGKVAWDEPGFGAVANVIADARHLLVQLDSGEVRLLKAVPQAYTEVARFQASGKTYSHPAYHGGVLYVRDPLSLTAWPIVPKP